MVTDFDPGITTVEFTGLVPLKGAAHNVSWVIWTSWAWDWSEVLFADHSLDQPTFARIVDDIYIVREDQWSQSREFAIARNLGWIKGTDADDLRKLMEYSDLNHGLSVYAVSNSVNSAAHDGHQLIKPITLGEPQTLF